jgi:calcineurin-like phosphoesterase family protein
MKYYISDLHFDHANMLKFEPEARPFRNVDEMNRVLIQKWNNKVKPTDEVYILGDFCFDNTGYKANSFLEQLNGTKYMIKGNHDGFLWKPGFDRDHFEWIRDYAEIADEVDGEGVCVCLFHYPIAVWNKKHHHSYHLFGHIHSNKADAGHHPLDFDLGDHAFNVGADVRDLEPKTLQELVDSKKRGY